MWWLRFRQNRRLELAQTVTALKTTIQQKAAFNYTERAKLCWNAAAFFTDEWFRVTFLQIMTVNLLLCKQHNQLVGWERWGVVFCISADDGVDSSQPVSQGPLMSATVPSERTERLLSTRSLFPPSLCSAFFHPSLPAAGFMSSPGLSSIFVTHRPHYWGCSQTGPAADGKGLQDMYGFCGPDKDQSATKQNTTQLKNKKNVVIWVWTSLYSASEDMWECHSLLQWVCSRVCRLKLSEALELVWPLGT